VRVVNCFKSCLEKEVQNEISSAKEAQIALELYEDCIDLCSGIINYMFKKYDRKIMSHTNSSILLIANHLLISSQAIRVLTLKGYYYEVEVLSRSYAEGIGLSIFLFENVEEAEKWYAGKKIDVTTIKLFNLIPKFFYSFEETNEMNVLYGELCNYVHHNLPALSDFLRLSKSERYVSDGEKMFGAPICQTPFDFDKEYVNGLPCYPLLLSYVLMKTLYKEFNKKQKKAFMKQWVNLSRKWVNIDAQAEDQTR